MMQLLKIQINHDNLYQHTFIYILVCYFTLALVYLMFGIYFFFIIEIRGMKVQFMSFAYVNASLTLIAVQFKVIMYSMYLRFSLLNGFVE